MNKKELIKEITNKITVENDDDWWEELVINNKYYDCNIYRRVGVEPGFCENSDPNDLKIVVYGVIPDKMNPGFNTTNIEDEKFSFNVNSFDLNEADTNKTLTINDVNFKQLEQQRKDLIGLEATLPDGKGLEALKGVLSMLDSWSDKEYFKSINYEEV